MGSRITTEQYTQSIIKLIGLAQQDTSGSRAAAQVLLSAYNGEDFQLNITDLTELDENYYQHAINVIRGVVEITCYPHRLIDNGNKVFHELWDDWYILHIDQRHKIHCRMCDGKGMVNLDGDGEGGKPCTSCSGTGRVCSCTIRNVVY